MPPVGRRGQEMRTGAWIAGAAVLIVLLGDLPAGSAATTTFEVSAVLHRDCSLTLVAGPQTTNVSRAPPGGGALACANVQSALTDTDAFLYQGGPNTICRLTARRVGGAETGGVCVQVLQSEGPRVSAPTALQHSASGEPS